MAWYNIGDWFSGANTGNTLSQADQQANFDRLQNDLAVQTDNRTQDGTISTITAAQNAALTSDQNQLDSTSAAALGGFGSGLTDVFTGDSSKDNGDAGPGIGAVFKDLLILGAIGGAVWLFVSFGGFAWLKGFTKKFKWAWFAIVGVAAVVGYLLYSTFKKTGSDASSVAQNVFSNPFKFLFGS